MDLIVGFINEIKKGLLVVLNDGDDNAIINNKTAEILLLLGELRYILEEMKYCDTPELSKEIRELVERKTKELHDKRGVDIRKEYPELDNFLSDDKMAQSEYSDHLISELFHDGFYENKAVEDAPAIVEEDWYDATLQELYEAIELARRSLDECSCEEINIPSGNVTNNFYNENDISEIENLKELIKETIKESTK